MRLRLLETQVGLMNSTTRIPFRYGSACLTRCPQAVLGVTIETGGKRQAGYSGDCLPPSWFDKSPDKDYCQQIDDMLAVIALAEKTFREEFAALTEFFPAWLIAYERVQSRAAEWQFTPLLSSFGISLVERAIMDAMARAANMSFHAAVRADVFRIRPAEIHPQLPSDMKVSDCLSREPLRSVFVRHTVGLGDPLTAAEIADDIT